MNYLAHAFLSGENPSLLIGNFVADHIRGNNFTGLTDEVIAGIKLHRMIDTFSDSHPLFRASKRIFYPEFEKYSGILVDIYFDHLLAKHWPEHSKVLLKDFSQNVYSVYQQNRSILPQRSNRFLDYVIANNIYQAYGEQEGIFKVLFHLSHRISHGVSLDNSKSIFLSNIAEFKNNFDGFFADAKEEFL